MPEVNHRTLGQRCWIGDTTHPVARQHRYEPCTIKAAWRFGSVLMVSIVLEGRRGEVTINGLFLYELQNEEGRSLRHKE